jgi:hypothetical protein
MAPAPEIRALSVVAVGEFNPTIFQPKWFSLEGLLTRDEGENANVQIIHPDVTAFELPWLGINVTRDRFQASSLAQPYFERVVALLSGTFGLLKHTPMRLLGINHEAHFRASTVDKWHALGHKLAPKDFWRQWFSAPGMQSLSIKQVPREDKEPGYVQITVEPSLRLGPVGVYVRVNDHFEHNPGDEYIGASKVLTWLTEKWGPSTAFADKVFTQIAEQL